MRLDARLKRAYCFGSRRVGPLRSARRRGVALARALGLQRQCNHQWLPGRFGPAPQDRRKTLGSGIVNLHTFRNRAI